MNELKDFTSFWLSFTAHAHYWLNLADSFCHQTRFHTRFYVHALGNHRLVIVTRVVRFSYS